MNGSVEEFLESVASKTPTPGGGAVAALTAALAAALGRMVLNYSLGKATLATHEEHNREALGRLEALGRRAMESAERDAEAYTRLNALSKLDESDQRRQREWDDAVNGAIAAPSSVLDDAVAMLRLLQDLVGSTNRLLASDLAMAAILAEAAARSAAWNVQINVPLLGDETRRTELAADVDRRVSDARTRVSRIEAHLKASLT